MKAYTFHQETLLRLLATLFATAGIVEGGAAVATLPRLIRNEIQRVLLPIESAVRRIIFFRAQRMKATPAPKKKTKQSRVDDERYANQRKNRREDRRRKMRGKIRAVRVAVFWLFDKKLYDPLTADPHKRPRRGGPGPRISCFDGSDPPREPVKEKPKRDPNDASKLCRRMQAVMRALKDIEGHALRLRRLLDKRAADPSKKQRTDPIRHGLPPGYRPEQTKEVDEILYECDLMARETVPPNV